MSTQHLVYFLHAKGDDYCKIGESTSKRLRERIRAFEASKASAVKLLGYQFCKDKASAVALERFLLHHFDRIEKQELVGIDTDLVKYILEHCDHKETAYLTSLWSMPDYDAFNPEDFEAALQKHACDVKFRKASLASVSEKHQEAKRLWEETVAEMESAAAAYTAAVHEQMRYLDQLAIALRQEHWEISKIVEVTGLDAGRVRNLVYKHSLPKLLC